MFNLSFVLPTSKATKTLTKKTRFVRWMTFIFCFEQVHYNFNKILMLQEPLLVVGAFYILFFTVIIYVRLDFAITKVRFENKKFVSKVSGTCRIE